MQSKALLNKVDVLTGQVESLLENKKVLESVILILVCFIIGLLIYFANKKQELQEKENIENERKRILVRRRGYY